MNKSNKTKQTLAFMTVLTIAIVVFYVLFFNNLKEKNENISLIKNEVDISIQKEIKLRSVKDLIKDTQEDRLKLDTYFVADDMVVDFIEDIEQLGKDADVEVEVVSVNVSGDGDVSESLNLDFKADGKWRDIFYLLTLIEHMPLRINVSKANLRVVYSDGPTANSSGLWEGFFSVSAVKLK